MIPAFLSGEATGRVLVKICGVRRAEDVAAAVEAGADAVGFNFWPGSRRYVAPAEAAALVRLVPPGVAAIGVFVDPPREELLAALLASGVAAVQLHGDEAPEALAGLPVPALKALRVGSEADLAIAPRYAAAGAIALLLDAPSAGFGGAGVPFDWSLARRAVDGGLRVVLAGGLSPESVARAVRTARPWAVDVASGVERSPGVKDGSRMAAFVAAARAASNETRSTR